PRVLAVEGELIKLYDPAYHVPAPAQRAGLIRQDSHDMRWVRVRRPTVMVGGELTMDSLEIRYTQKSNLGEAPLQMKSNGGSRLIDDFGRQRINPVELLNRWIVPLEKRYDFLTLASGKKIQVPFDQLILFSTNLEPRDLVDEAFLRRIPFKINVPDPDEAEFHRLFQLAAASFRCEVNEEVVDDLLRRHYRPQNPPRPPPPTPAPRPAPPAAATPAPCSSRSTATAPTTPCPCPSPPSTSTWPSRTTSPW